MIYSSKYILVLFLSLLSLSSIVSCQQLGLGDSGDELSDYNCISRSSCQPCPVDELESPVCKPFNNRQLFRCHLTTSNSNQDFNLMWHSCGKLPNVERNTFIKFISLNFALAVTATVIVILRSNHLANAQYDRLAKTVGLPDLSSLKSPDGPIAAAGRLFKFLRT